MADYQLTAFGVKKSTGELIPADLTNRHWIEFQKWLAAGNTADPADAIRAEPTRSEAVGARLTSDPLFQALIVELASRLGISTTELLTSIRARVR
jgi:hypothetical protein